METFKVVALGALGIASCLALLLVAGRTWVRWHRLVVSLVALLGLVSQCIFWGGVTRILKGFEVGGSYFWLYAGLGTSVAGMVWALVLLGTTFSSRRLTD
jgi:hypothetical protein